jgi:small conductance mechanosensitive channel
MVSQFFSSELLEKLGGFVTFIDKLAIIIIVLLVTLIVKSAANRIVNHMFDKKKGGRLFRAKIADGRRETLKSMTKNLIKYILYFIAIMIILGLFIDISSILTVAGVGGIVVSLGLKSFIEDVVSGFFIIFEDQYNVGDLITVDSYDGIVTAIGIRTTTILSYAGDVHIINNGQITIVTNHSRKAQRLMFDLKIAYDEDLEKAYRVIQDVCEKAAKEPYYVETPQLWGVQEMDSAGYSLRIYATARNLMHWDAERALKKSLLEAFKAENIRLATNLNVTMFGAEQDADEK